MKLAVATVAFLFTGLSSAQAKTQYYGKCSKLDSSCDVGLPTQKTCDAVSILQYRMLGLAYSQTTQKYPCKKFGNQCFYIQDNATAKCDKVA